MSSPKPSPAGSVRSQPGRIANSCGGNTIPYNIPSITSSCVNITAGILSACGLWEQADALARENKGKFVPSGFSVLCVVVLFMYLLKSEHSV